MSNVGGSWPLGEYDGTQYGLRDADRCVRSVRSERVLSGSDGKRSGLDGKSQTKIPGGKG